MKWPHWGDLYRRDCWSCYWLIRGCPDEGEILLDYLLFYWSCYCLLAKSAIFEVVESFLAYLIHYLKNQTNHIDPNRLMKRYRERSRRVWAQLQNTIYKVSITCVAPKFSITESLFPIGKKENDNSLLQAAIHSVTPQGAPSRAYLASPTLFLSQDSHNWASVR